MKTHNNQYLILCFIKTNGYILSTSQPLTLNQLKKNYNSYCLDMMLSLKGNPNIDDIGFRFKKITVKKMNTNKERVIKFNQLAADKLKEGLQMIEGEIRLSKRYSDIQLIDLKNTLKRVLTFCNQHLLIDKFLPEIRIQFISEKINELYTELVFLAEQDYKDGWSMLVSTFIYLLSWCEQQEYYEVECNLYKFAMLNFSGDIIQEKNNFLALIK